MPVFLALCLKGMLKSKHFAAVFVDLQAFALFYNYSVRNVQEVIPCIKCDRCMCVSVYVFMQSGIFIYVLRVYVTNASCFAIYQPWADSALRTRKEFQRTPPLLANVVGATSHRKDICSPVDIAVRKVFSHRLCPLMF
jgi:hypothetical protein